MSSHPTVPCPTDLCKNCHHLIARHEYTFSVVDDYQVCLLSPKSPSQLCLWNSRPILPWADSHLPWDRTLKDSEPHPCVQATWRPPNTSLCLVEDAQLTWHGNVGEGRGL